MYNSIIHLLSFRLARHPGSKAATFRRMLRSAALTFGVAALLYLPMPKQAFAGGTGLSAGDPCWPPGSMTCANPITLPSGNSHQKATDFTTAGQNPLAVVRYSNSLIGNPGGSFGNWRWTYDRGLAIFSSQVWAIRADGKEIDFDADGSGGWKGITNLDLKLKKQGSVWTLTDWHDNVETYEEISFGGTALTGRLRSIKARNGYTQTLNYVGISLQPTSVTDSFGRTLRITYGSHGRISSITCPDGLVVTYQYQDISFLKALRRVSYSTSPASSQSYVYQSNGNFQPLLTGIIDENGNRYSTWAFDPPAFGDSLGQAISNHHAGAVDLYKVDYTSSGATVTRPRGLQEVYKCHWFKASTTLFQNVPHCTEIARLATPTTAAAVRNFTYDGNGYPASETGWNGNLTNFTYDARGNETSRTEAAGTPQERTISTSWHPGFHLPKQINEPNRTTVFTYDARGNVLTKETKLGAASRVFAYTYNAFGQILTETDPRGNTTTYTYTNGNLKSVANALGHVTRITSHDGAGRPLTIVDPNGVTTTLTYNLRGRLTSQTIGALKTSYAYDPVGNLIRVTLPDSSFIIYGYDVARRLTNIEDALGNRIVYTLDNAGNKIKEETFDPSATLKQTRSNVYDALNRLIKTIGAQGQTTGNTYDKEGNLTSVTDPLGHRESYAYDALNRLVRTIDPDSEIIAYRHNANDELTHVTDPRGLTTIYSRNGVGDLAVLISPDSGRVTRTFDAAGNIATSTDARGMKTVYSYDALNRMIRAAYADGAATTWKYDLGANGIGRLGKITDATGSTSYSYDANGHVTQKRQIVGAVELTTLYGYDAGGRLTRITYPSGKQVTYSYNAAGRVSRVAANGQTLVAGVTYMPFGVASRWTLGSAHPYRRFFDLDGRITRIDMAGVRDYQLIYDTASRVSRILETGLHDKQFAYDALGRLTLFVIDTSVQAYEYDADGNRTKRVARNGATTSTQTYNYDAASNRLLSITGGDSFTYDPAGNMLSHSSSFADFTYEYDARNRLAKSYLGAIASTLLINGLGQRVSQIRGTGQTYFVYDEAGNLIGEYNSTGGVIQETAWIGNLPIAVLKPGTQFYVTPDHLGAPHQVTNADNGTVWLWNHDPFGQNDPWSAGGFTYNLRFPGQYHDRDAKLNYNYFRDYDPRTGRYIQSDPVGLAGGINTYAYANANPVSDVDPSGLFSFSAGPLSVSGSSLSSLSVTVGPVSASSNGIKIDPLALLDPDLASIYAKFIDRQIKIEEYNRLRDLLKKALFVEYCPSPAQDELKKLLEKLRKEINELTKEINQLGSKHRLAGQHVPISTNLPTIPLPGGAVPNGPPIFVPSN
ncbi:MAG: DUF6531 domain-containing protein [Beijerinckiaceae bacterium]|nr:DUF6531 domain-containing protein [Beijerinckiaceae bacterium]